MDSQSNSNESRGDVRSQFSLRALFKLTLVVAAILTIGTLRRWRFGEHDGLFTLWTVATLVPILAVWAVGRLRLISPRSLAVASIVLYAMSMVMPAFSALAQVRITFGLGAFLLAFQGLIFLIRTGMDPDAWMPLVACLMGVGANIAFLLGFVALVAGFQRAGVIRFPRNVGAVSTVLALCALIALAFSGPRSEPMLHALYPGCGFWLASMLALWLGVRAAQQQAEPCRSRKGSERSELFFD